MILLILVTPDPVVSPNLFKFHYDSINSYMYIDLYAYYHEFKFHYDSINSSLLPPILFDAI